jgi:hypothetical protein
MSQSLNEALNISDERAEELAKTSVEILKASETLDQALTKLYSGLTSKEDLTTEEKEAIFSIFALGHYMSTIRKS